MYRNNKPKMFQWGWRSWLLFGVASVGVVTLSRMVGTAAGNHLTAAEAASVAAPAQEPKVVAIVTRQDGEGVTADMMDLAFLGRLSAYMVDLHEEKTGERLSPKAAFLEVGNKRLAVVRLETQGFTPIVHILGIEGDELVRVGCISNTLIDVPIVSGVCADRIKQAFNVSISEGQ